MTVQKKNLSQKTEKIKSYQTDEVPANQKDKNYTIGVIAKDKEDFANYVKSQGVRKEMFLYKAIYNISDLPDLLFHEIEYTEAVADLCNLFLFGAKIYKQRGDQIHTNLAVVEIDSDRKLFSFQKSTQKIRLF